VYLSKPPQFIIRYKTGLRLIIDGTYFSRTLCLILYYDSVRRYPLYFRYSSNEFYKELKEDLQILKSLGIEVASVTCDGKKSIIRAVRKVYEQVTLQRCTVHVQRNVRNWLTGKPKSEAAKELRYLISLLHHIKNITEQNMWIIAFNYWYSKHKVIIEEKVYRKHSGRWWYKHRQLRISAISIKNAIPDLFHFIQTPDIPKSTNGIDSYFGHLKTNLKIHRGLSAVNKKSFILWFLHMKSLRL
jgi:transposase-like protein